MISSQTAPPATRRIRIRWARVLGLLVVGAAITVALGHRWPASSPSTAPSTLTAPSSSEAAPPIGAPRGEQHGALGQAGGAVPDGTTVFDEEIPGVANLDPALAGALRQAATVAQDNGVRFVVDSGWRSPEYQAQLLREAVSEYGSEAEAARWVATPDKSAHVSGDAVDIGPSVAARWLAEHGARYGLCRVYGNEPWHFERRPDAIGGGCPAMYADPTRDPRTQR